MLFASEFLDPIKTDGQLDLMATVLTAGSTRKSSVGAEKVVWNSQKKELERGWLYQKRGMTMTLSPVSIPNNAVYLNTYEKGVFRLIGLDWDTGKEIAEIELGTSYKFHTAGFFLFPLPDGDLYVCGMFGPVKILKKGTQP